MFLFKFLRFPRFRRSEGTCRHRIHRLCSCPKHVLECGGSIKRERIQQDEPHQPFFPLQTLLERLLHESPTLSPQPVMQFIVVLLSFVAATLAQGISIAAPSVGRNITAGQQTTVSVMKPVRLVDIIYVYSQRLTFLFVGHTDRLDGDRC